MQGASGLETLVGSGFGFGRVCREDMPREWKGVTSLNHRTLSSVQKQGGSSSLNTLPAYSHKGQLLPVQDGS